MSFCTSILLLRMQLRQDETQNYCYTIVNLCQCSCDRSWEPIKIFKNQESLLLLCTYLHVTKIHINLEQPSNSPPLKVLVQVIYKYHIKHSCKYIITSKNDAKIFGREILKFFILMYFHPHILV